MRYGKMVEGVFLARPNRFIAHIEINGRMEVCHVKNTGRCRELLPKGAKVWCLDAAGPHRKTRYALITVRKGERLINMDSQAPNTAAREWLEAGGLGEIENLKAECRWGESRFDFSFMKDGRQCFLEVKGVTLESDGVCAFPDAPTQRGTKHLRELAKLAEAGFGAYVIFVIQMEGVKYLHPNDSTDKPFGDALRSAQKAGVDILAYDCKIAADSLKINEKVEVKL